MMPKEKPKTQKICNNEKLTQKNNTNQKGMQKVCYVQYLPEGPLIHPPTWFHWKVDEYRDNWKVISCPKFFGRKQHQVAFVTLGDKTTWLGLEWVKNLLRYVHHITYIIRRKFTTWCIWIYRENWTKNSMNLHQWHTFFYCFIICISCLKQDKSVTQTALDDSLKTSQKNNLRQQQVFQTLFDETSVWAWICGL